jgi:RNA 2',3'-cyclic 3'-phosphodiesterase
MAKRIFIALPLSEPLQQLALQWQQDHADLPVRWITPKNLHVTVTPPWQENDIDNVISKLRQASIQMPAFLINFDRISFGPDPKVPRLIWASGPTPPEMVELKQQIESALSLLPGSRPLKLHLTLARFTRDSYQNFPVKHLSETVVWQDQVSSFALLESRLTPAGSDYEAIERFLL